MLSSRRLLGSDHLSLLLPTQAAQTQAWDQRDGNGKKIIIPQPIKHVYKKKVTFIEHTYVARRLGGV